MSYSEDQYEVITSVLKSNKVKIFRYNLKKLDGTYGYVVPVDDGYEIHLDNSKNESVTDALLIHEIGHIHYGHVRSIKDIDEFYSFIESRIDDLNLDLPKTKDKIHDYANICMDLEVNSKLLTFRNFIQINHDYGIELCTCSSFGFEPGHTYKEYVDDVLNYFANLPKSPNNDQSNNPQDESSSSTQDNSSDNKSDASDGESKINDLSDVSTEYVGSSDKKIDSSDSDITDKLLDALKSISDDRNASNDLIGNMSANRGVLESGNSVIDKKAIARLSELMSKKSSMSYSVDSLKIHNRGNRSSNLMYSSIKRKRAKAPANISILVDVSVSMNIDYIVGFLRSLKYLNVHHDQGTHVVTWDTRIHEDYNLNEFMSPDLPKGLTAGGGTDLAPGVQYLIDKYHPTDIFVFTDLGTNLLAIDNLVNCNLYYVVPNDTKSKNLSNNDFQNAINQRLSDLKKCSGSVIYGNS